MPRALDALGQVIDRRAAQAALAEPLPQVDAYEEARRYVLGSPGSLRLSASHG